MRSESFIPLARVPARGHVAGAYPNDDTDEAIDRCIMAHAEQKGNISPGPSFGPGAATAWCGPDRCSIWSAIGAGSSPRGSTSKRTPPPIGRAHGAPAGKRRLHSRAGTRSGPPAGAPEAWAEAQSGEMIRSFHPPVPLLPAYGLDAMVVWRETPE